MWFINLLELSVLCFSFWGCIHHINFCVCFPACKLKKKRKKTTTFLNVLYPRPLQCWEQSEQVWGVLKDWLHYGGHLASRESYCFIKQFSTLLTSSHKCWNLLYKAIGKRQKPKYKDSTQAFWKGLCCLWCMEQRILRFSCQPLKPDLWCQVGFCCCLF